MPLWRSTLPEVNGWMQAPDRINEHWRLATRYERIWHWIFTPRFSYVEQALIALVVLGAALLGELWTLVPLTAFAIIIEYILKRATQPE